MSFIEIVQAVHSLICCISFFGLQVLQLTFAFISLQCIACILLANCWNVLFVSSSEVTWQKMKGQNKFSPLKHSLSQTLEGLYQHYFSIVKENKNSSDTHYNRVVTDDVEVLEVFCYNSFPILFAR
jgi:hypothetical protein